MVNSTSGTHRAGPSDVQEADQAVLSIVSQINIVEINLGNSERARKPTFAESGEHIDEDVVQVPTTKTSRRITKRFVFLNDKKELEFYIREADRRYRESLTAESHGEHAGEAETVPRMKIEKYSPMFCWKFGDIDAVCVICMGDIDAFCPKCEALQEKNVPTETCCRVLWGKCSHSFHSHCLYTWFDESGEELCPLDRQVFTAWKEG